MQASENATNALAACSLQPNMGSLPLGDDDILLGFGLIGEHGINT